MESTASDHSSFEADSRILATGDLKAVFLPGRGMLGASFKHQNVELLRRIEDLPAAAAKGSTAGIPLLHPWANRLAGSGYSAAGRHVTLDLSSPLLHLDEHGLAIHGVPWALLEWQVTDEKPGKLKARLEWSSRELLAVFPYRHRLDLIATLLPDGLELETVLEASTDGPVPVSFGFHPYFGLPESPRGQWMLELPPMNRLMLDSQGIPTGELQSFDGFNEQLGEVSFDDCFALLGGQSSFSLGGADRRITIEFLEGFGYAQIFAPKGKDYVAIEPMTAPTNALISGAGLQLVEPGDEYRAAFRIGVDSLL